MNIRLENTRNGVFLSDSSNRVELFDSGNGVDLSPSLNRIVLGETVNRVDAAIGKLQVVTVYSYSALAPWQILRRAREEVRL